MKIPVFLPVTREFGFRDEFAQDCLLQRRVRNEPDPLAAGTPVNTPIGSVPPGYPSPRASAPLRVRLRCPWYDHARDRKRIFVAAKLAFRERVMVPRLTSR